MEHVENRHPKIAIFASINLKGGRTCVRGILDYAHRHGPWRCMLLEGRDSEQAIQPGLLGFDGIIAHNLSRDEAKAVAAANVPVVLIEPWPQQLARGNPLADAPYVKMNSYDVGALAAQYYLDRGYKSFVYVGETLGLYWSADRRAGFVDTLAKRGFGCIVYDTFSARERRSWAAERPRMMRFLKGLEKPTAIFAAMDNRARLVLDACAEAGISVPEEIAVLGVDNDPIICESSVPTLSSIRTGGFRRGQMAASMLDDLMCSRPIRQRTLSIGPLSVVTRESTGYDAMRDPVLARALKFIHANAAGNGTAWMNAKGWSCYTSPGKTKGDTLAEFMYDAFERAFPDRKIRKDMSDGDRDWEANFTVLKNTKCPAVLLENFFYDNREECAWLLEPVTKARIADAIASGIMYYASFNL